MGFAEFLGNQRIVTVVRGMLASGRVPHAMLLAGPRGVGKYTLALMFAQAANCQRLNDDFCGECEPCRRIGRLAEPKELIVQGLSERGENVDAATVERVPLVLQTHPDVWAIVPDPIRLRNPVVRPVIHMGQLRAVQRAAYFKPICRRRVFIIDGAETMGPHLASIFLKILEEPPETATLVLLASNLNLLLPTILSRCLQFFLAPLAIEQVEALLEQHTGLKLAERKLAAQLSEGRPGVALGLEIEPSAQLRRDVIGVLERAVEPRSYADLFAETSQLVKNSKEPIENLLEVFYSLVTDLLELSSSLTNCSLRNPVVRRELEALSKKIDLDWIGRTVEGLDQLHGRLRRNINRQLGLDALAVSMANARGSAAPDITG